MPGALRTHKPRKNLKQDPPSFCLYLELTKSQSSLDLDPAGKKLVFRSGDLKTYIILKLISETARPVNTRDNQMVRGKEKAGLQNC